MVSFINCPHLSGWAFASELANEAAFYFISGLLSPQARERAPQITPSRGRNWNLSELRQTSRRSISATRTSSADIWLVNHLTYKALETGFCWVGWRLLEGEFGLLPWDQLSLSFWWKSRYLARGSSQFSPQAQSPNVLQASLDRKIISLLETFR